MKSSWMKLAGACCLAVLALACSAIGKGKDDASPTIASFVISPNPTSPGSKTTLTAVFSGGTATVDQGVGPVTSGVPVTITPNGTRTYTLTVTNQNGWNLKQITVELYPGVFTPAASMITGRRAHTATLLPNGKVFVAGGSGVGGRMANTEFYDPGTNSFSAAGSMSAARIYHRATLLQSGQVLLYGGDNAGTAELFDPATGGYTSLGPLTTPRDSLSATLLVNGKVLIAGGRDTQGAPLASAELFDPATGTFRPTGTMNVPRMGHSALLLPSGKVLIVDHSGSAEWFDPVKETFTLISVSSGWMDGRFAIPLPNGSVLVSPFTLFDPGTGAFTTTGSMLQLRIQCSATLLANGNVLVAGGDSGNVKCQSAEVYDPATGYYWPTGPLGVARSEHTATRLADGQVVIIGGATGFGISDRNITSTTELYR